DLTARSPTWNCPVRRPIERFLGAAQHELMRCRTGIVSHAESGTIPVQRCIANALHRVREKMN
ncbi:MAG: hypothetical protein WB868_12430, partial [Xanthobacteraceae bacterium]